MEIKIFLTKLAVIFALTSCTNTPDLETGEIRTFQIIKNAFEQQKHSKGFVDARTLLSREQIDAANIPVLFVNWRQAKWYVDPYPGQGVGRTWLGADGATITLEKGSLKASRGMGDDLMGSSSSMPHWSKINKKVENYSRQLAHITGNNTISKRVFTCNIEKTSSEGQIEIWDVNFKVAKFEESCSNSSFVFTNTYHVDNQGIVRKSLQYHSDTLGSIKIERLDR